MQRRTLTFLSSLAVAGLATLALAGCGSEAPSDSSSAQPGETSTDKDTAKDAASSSPGASGTAVFSFSDTMYTAELQFCALTAGGDALFHGLAFDSDGAEVGYLDGDFTGLGDSPHGEARIDFGATAKMQSTDEFVAMGSVGGDIVVTDSSDTSLIVMGGAWEADGTGLPVAMLKVNC